MARACAVRGRAAAKRPIYRDTAAYGHFGRSKPGFTWEQTSRLDEFKAAVGV